MQATELDLSCFKRLRLRTRKPFPDGLEIFFDFYAAGLSKPFEDTFYTLDALSINDLDRHFLPLTSYSQYHRRTCLFFYRRFGFFDNITVKTSAKPSDAIERTFIFYKMKKSSKESEQNVVENGLQ